MHKNSSVLLMTSALLSMANGAGAQEIPSPKSTPKAIQESLKSVPDSSGLNTSGKPGKAAPRASRAPTKPMLLLDEKNLGLGCAQP